MARQIVEEGKRFMVIQCRSTWQGSVGIRDRYVEEAKAGKYGFRIVVKGQEMDIPAEEIEIKIAKRSKEWFEDKFSKSIHRLVYYKWKPKINPQKSLFKA